MTEPFRAGFLSYASQVAQAAKRICEALREIDVALRLDPESYEVNSAVANWNMAMRRFREAIPFYEKACGAMETDF